MQKVPKTENVFESLSPPLSLAVCLSLSLFNQILCKEIAFQHVIHHQRRSITDTK